MKKVITLLGMALVASALTFSCKKDNKSNNNGGGNNNPSTEKKYVLVIDNGAQAIPMGKEVPLKAHLVSETGEVTTASNVTWSCDVGSISGSNFSAGSSVTVGIISASAQYNGKTYTSSVPVSIEGATNLFAVVPGAIIWSTLGGDIPLTAVYLGTQSSSYSFSSANSDIASVSSGGVVSFHKAGNTVIKVTAVIGGQTSEILVPVLVVGEPEIPLPVTRVVVTPALGELFRNEELQLNVKAYNSKNEDVTNTVSFSYVVEEKKDENQPEELHLPIPITVDNAGKVKTVSIGGAYVKVTANGIIGQAEIIVNPDTIITVNPFYVSFGMDYTQFPPVPGPSDQIFTAKMQKVDRDKYRQKNPNFLIDLPNPSNLQWMLPETGIAEIDNMFKVVTLSDKTTTSVKVTPIQGKVGATILIAQSGIYGGAASIMVNP